MASTRKKANSKVVLTLMLVIILILVAWYFLFYTPTKENIAKLGIDVGVKQGDVDVLNIQVAKQTRMLKDIDYLKTINPAVPAHDNYKQLATILDVILAQVTDFTVDFADPKLTDSGVKGVKTARRVLSVSYSAPTYSRAKDVIADIQDIPFRLQISNLNIAMQGTNIFNPEDPDAEIIHSLGDSPVSVNMSITFFENDYSGLDAQA